ncbi:hypothetical protein [Streptomyces sp. NPDC058542]|uniref:hypothetical protein n=1 Tax=Streptomyces sp. NPDC058542 TaxID=3346543 RepID=UPI0036594B19
MIVTRSLTKALVSDRGLLVSASARGAGVAVNVADPDGSMLFPPVVGIVQDDVAVGADLPDARAGHGDARAEGAGL